MRFALEFEETNSEQKRSSTTKEELEWLPLQNHPVFAAINASTHADSPPRNLLAWDGDSRLYFWDPHTNSLHRLSLRLADPDHSSVLAVSPSKVPSHPSPSSCNLGFRFPFRLLPNCLTCKLFFLSYE